MGTRPPPMWRGSRVADAESSRPMTPFSRRVASARIGSAVRPLAVLALAISVIGGAEGGSPADAADPTVAHVHVLDTLPIPTFSPAQVVIRPGNRVEWDNHAPRIHTITHTLCPRIDSRNDEATCLFDTTRDLGHDLGTGDRFEVTFETPGIYEYLCAIHRFGGQITVLAEDPPLPDLVVDALDVHPTPLGLSRRVRAVVRNAGDGVAPESRVRFSYRGADGEWVLFGDVEIPALSRGQAIEINQDWTTINRIGDFALLATSDGASSVVEVNESNNDRTTSVSILVPEDTLPGRSLPDPPQPEPVTTRLPEP